MKRLLARFLIMLLVFVAQGCALKNTPTNPPTQEGRITQSGRQVIAAADTVLTGVDKLVTSGVLSKPDALRVVEAMRRVGVEGERLSTVMLEVDASKDAITRENGLRRAAAILKSVQRLVTTAGSNIGNPEARATVIDLLDGVTSIVIEVAMLLPAPTN